jgi:predicted ATPase
MVEQSIWPFASAIPFVGREEEVRQINEWLGDANVCVIALTGPSGIGKTRLALEVTRERAP